MSQRWWWAASLLLGASHGAPAASRGPASLAVHSGRGWITWWSTDAAPRRWAAPLDRVEEQIRWRRAARGVEWGEFSLAGSGEAFRVRVIVVRLDPAQLDLSLVRPDDDGGFPGRWSVDRVPASAVLAVNAGQFTGAPWGWVLQDGVERQAPGHGPLAPGIVVGRDGAVQIAPPDSLAATRPAARQAFQSYPTLLEGDGDVPLPLQQRGMGIDLDHRDARLALGVQRDGHVLLALTRFEGLGGVLENLPLGLTTPEMAAVMGALGAHRAVLLDGGISSQLLIRDGAERRIWPGWRKVAMGLVALPRTQH